VPKLIIRHKPMMRIEAHRASAKMKMRVNKVSTKTFAGGVRKHRKQQKPGDNQRHDRIAGIECRRSSAVGRNSPSGLATSTIAIRR